MKTHLIALAIALTVTGLAMLVLDADMRGGAERARLANSEPERVVITASRTDQQVAAAKAGSTF
jgi:hypothetical protein